MNLVRTNFNFIRTKSNLVTTEIDAETRKTNSDRREVDFEKRKSNLVATRLNLQARNTNWDTANNDLEKRKTDSVRVGEASCTVGQTGGHQHGHYSKHGLTTWEGQAETDFKDPRMKSATRFYRNVLQSTRADVLRARTNQPIVLVLFEHVGGPSRDAAAREYRREQIRGNAKSVVGRR